MQRAREIEHLREDLEELAEAHLKEGEEEELFSEYTLLSNAEELKTTTQSILQGLEGEKLGSLTLLNRTRPSLSSLQKIGPWPIIHGRVFPSFMFRTQRNDLYLAELCESHRI